MTGKSHYAIGCALGVAVAYIGIKHEDISLVASALACPLGSMLPDIDHNNSKIGRQRKQIVDTVRKIATYGGLGLFGFTVFTNWVATGVFGVTELLFNGILPSVITYLPIIVCILLATSEGVKKRFKFFTKHRGIMHTLWPSIGMYFGSISTEFLLFKYLLFGLTMGYLSHLFADCETHAGCPILWPLYSNPIRIFNVTTGTKAETFMMVCDLCVITAAAWIL